MNPKKLLFEYRRFKRIGYRPHIARASACVWAATSGESLWAYLATRNHYWRWC